MPGVVNVTVAVWPGSIICGSVGSPPSRSWTECVKWSSLVHVTVVPAATVIAAGENL
jgi:hypothetical protein